MKMHQKFLQNQSIHESYYQEMRVKHHFIIVQMGGVVQVPCQFSAPSCGALIFLEFLVGGLDSRPDAVDVGAHQRLAIGIGVKAVEGVLGRQHTVLVGMAAAMSM